MTALSTEDATAGSPDHVSGVLNYLADKDQHPVSYNFKPPPGVPARTGTYAKFAVPIHNARKIMRELSLDRQGFAVTRQQSAVANFYDAGEVRNVYYPEVEREHIARVLAASATLEEAAETLGINVTTLWRKRRRYGIE